MLHSRGMFNNKIENDWTIHHSVASEESDDKIELLASERIEAQSNIKCQI